MTAHSNPIWIESNNIWHLTYIYSCGIKIHLFDLFLLKLYSWWFLYLSLFLYLSTAYHGERLTQCAQQWPWGGSRNPLVFEEAVLPSVMSEITWMMWQIHDMVETRQMGHVALAAITETIITVTSRWRLKSPASRLFAQPFIQVQIKENIKAPRHCSLYGNPPVAGRFPSQMDSNAENVFIWWPHHGYPSALF